MATGRQCVPHFQDGFVLFIVDCGQRTCMLARYRIKVVLSLVGTGL